MVTNPLTRLTAALLGRRYFLRDVIAEGRGRCVLGGRLGTALGPEIVLKVIQAPPGPDWEHALRTFELTRTAATLRHSFLVPILDCGVVEEERLLYVVMERIHGLALNSYFQQAQRDLTVGAMVHIFQNIASGIDAIHEAGLIHRDIKPANILFCQKDHCPKIIDFGMVLGRSQIEEKAEADAFGTPTYVAPEQIIGTQFTHLVDVYSLAMTIYVLLTRCPPYDVRTAREMLLAQMHREPVRLRRRNCAWPSELEAVLRAGLAKNPMDRPQSAVELTRLLAESLHAFTPLRLSSFFDGSLNTVSSESVFVDMG